MNKRYYDAALWLLLAACVAFLWLPLLFESLWLDETVTAFVLRHGSADPTLAAGPSLDQTIYYWLPCASAILFGFSEFSLRLPSLLATLISLWLIAKLAGRFVNPQAGWVAVLLGFIPHEFARQATDARPYGIGTLLAVASVWFLVRWLDNERWPDAVLFGIFAALLVRVHLIYWPFYAVFIAYAWARGKLRKCAIVFGCIALAIVPMIPVTLRLLGNAKSHVVIAMPSWGAVIGGVQLAVVAGVGVAAWLLSRKKPAAMVPNEFVLLTMWWLWQPLCLLAVSLATGNSMFVPRYFSLALPGAMLMATALAGRYLPNSCWKPVALGLGIGILAVHAVRGGLPTRNSHWREAAAQVNSYGGSDTAMPVICPSPFVEGEPPAWTAGYTLPGFLYAPLDIYPVHGRTVLLPARVGPEGVSYAEKVLREQILPARRFVVYGGVYGIDLWTTWFYTRPELATWSHRLVGNYGDAGVIAFEAPHL